MSDLVQQSTGTTEQGDPPSDRCRRYFPDRTSLIRLVGEVLAEKHDQWTEGRRYLGLDVLARSRVSLVTPETGDDNTIDEEANSTSRAALTA